MTQVQVITGVERRRRWSVDEKRRIVEAAFASGASVSAVARQADITQGHIYRWRRDLMLDNNGFAKVAVIPEGTARADECSAGVEIALGNGTHVRIPVSAPSELALAIIKALVRR
jgi:transposase